MRTLTLWQIEMVPWYAFLIVWVIAAVRVKQDKASEPFLARLTTIAYAGIAFALLFSDRVPFALLRQRFLPDIEGPKILGVALTYAGAAVAIWARVILGSNWSAEVRLKFGHELVRSGPYAYVRHPIYTGVLLSVMGTALVVGEWRCIAAIALIAVALGLKASREEQFMVAEFGDAYFAYRRTTGFLLPKW